MDVKLVSGTTSQRKQPPNIIKPCPEGFRSKSTSKSFLPKWVAPGAITRRCHPRDHPI